MTTANSSPKEEAKVAGVLLEMSVFVSKMAR
jgi:hypothetical protein